MPGKVVKGKKLRGREPARTKPVAKVAKPKKPAKPVKEAKGTKPSADGKKLVKKAEKPAPAAAKTAVVAKAVAPKEPPKRKRKSSVVRLKAYWGVFNQMLKRVAVFEYAERKQADKKAAELSTNAKQPHFVQLVKEVIRDED